MQQTNLQRWDLLYYYQIHCIRQRALGNIPCTYEWFRKRLKKLNLHDAIYYPRVERQVRDKKLKPTIQDAARRKTINRLENIQIIDFKHLEKVEMPNRIQMPKPKKSLRVRFLELFKRN